MGQCVTKCKNPSSSLGSKSGEKDAGKSHGKKGGGATHKEEAAKSPAEVIFNGTKAPEVVVESPAPAPPSPRPCSDSSLAAIEDMFSRYKDEQEDAILEEGMERFCLDLTLDPAEFRVLLLAWKFQAATMCRFTRKEFVEGCRAMGADSLAGICSGLPVLLEESQGEESFKDLYRFTFTFGLEAELGQRSLQRSIAIALWRLVFTLRPAPLLERWLDFLSENPCGVRGISRDTWNMFLNFTQSIGQDLSNYSEDEAWPSLFDSFVEWETERRRREEPDQGRGSDGF